jgi:hypothetical protein
VTRHESHLALLTAFDNQSCVAAVCAMMPVVFHRIYTAVAAVLMLKCLDITPLQCISVACCTIQIFIHTLKSHSCHGSKALLAIPCCLWWSIHILGISYIAVKEYLSAVYPSAYMSTMTDHLEPHTAFLNTHL